MKIGDEILTEKQNILNGLNKHFASVGKSFYSTAVNYKEVAETLNQNQLKSFKWQDITETELSTIINCLNPKKSSGPDETPITITTSPFTYPHLMQTNESISLLRSIP